MLGAIQIIRDTFWANFRPPCVIWWQCPVPPAPVFDVTLKVFKKLVLTHKNAANLFLEKYNVTLWMTWPPPSPLWYLVTLPPPPREGHVLFKWPLTINRWYRKTRNWPDMCIIIAIVYNWINMFLVNGCLGFCFCFTVVQNLKLICLLLLKQS